MNTGIAYLAFSFFKISCFISSVISMRSSVLSLNEKDKRNQGTVVLMNSKIKLYLQDYLSQYFFSVFTLKKSQQSLIRIQIGHFYGK